MPIARWRAARPNGMNAPDGLVTPRRYWAAIAIWLAIGMATLDGAIANIALPTIAHALHAQPASALWIINAYHLAIIIALVPFAALGGSVGYRVVYIGGMIVFAIGSLGCALSQGLAQIVAARVVQGLGTAAMFATNAALVRFTYPERMLGRGIGLNAAVIAASAALGPSLAAAILAIARWQWLFAINLPIGAAAIAIALRTLPGDGTPRRRFDGVAAVLNIAAAAGLVVGVAGLALGDPRGAAALATGIAAAGLLLRRDAGRSAPMFPTDLLRIGRIRLPLALMVAVYAAYMLAFVALPFQLAEQPGRSVVAIGLLITPWPVAAAIAAPFAGRLADRYPDGRLGSLSLFAFAAGLAALAGLSRDAATIDIVWRMALCGFGFGFFQSPNNRAIIVAAPRHRSGAAGGLLAISRHLGQAGGVGMIALLFRSASSAPTVAALGIAAGIAGAAGVAGLVGARGGTDST